MNHLKNRYHQLNKYSTVEWLFPNSHAHAMLSHIAFRPLQFSIVYNKEDHWYKCIDDNGLCEDFVTLDDAELYIQDKFDQENTANQYEVIWEGSKRSRQYTILLSDIGHKMLNALDNCMMWNVGRRQPDVNRSIVYILGQNFDTPGSCNPWMIEIIRRIKNRRIRNVVLDQIYSYCQKSIFDNNRYYDAVTYYDTLFEAGFIKHKDFDYVITIQNKKLRDELTRKLVYYKLTGDNSMAGVHLANDPDLLD